MMCYDRLEVMDRMSEVSDGWVSDSFDSIHNACMSLRRVYIHKFILAFSTKLLMELQG